MSRIARRAVSISLLVLAACSSGGGGGEPDEVSIAASGPSLPMLVFTYRDYSATVTGATDHAVTWSLQEGATAGTISAAGRYAASATPGTYHVIAVAHADSTKADTVAVTVHGFGTPVALGLPAYGAAVSSTGKIALADNATKVRFLTTAPGDSVTVNGTPVHVIFNATGTTAWTGLQTDEVLVRMQVSPAQELGRVSFGHSIYNLALDAAGTGLFVTTADGWLFKVNPTTLAKIDSVELASASNGLAFDPAGTRLYVSTIAAGWLYAITPATMAKADSFNVGSGAQRVAVSPSGDSVYVANEGVGGVNVVRISTRTVSTKTMGGTPYGIGISPDGAALYVTLRTAGTIRIMRREGLDSLTTMTVGGTPRNVAIDPNGGFVVVTTESDAVKVE